MKTKPEPLRLVRVDPYHVGGLGQIPAYHLSDGSWVERPLGGWGRYFLPDGTQVLGSDPRGRRMRIASLRAVEPSRGPVRKTEAEIEAFQSELTELMQRHGIQIEHEDGHGGFLFTELLDGVAEELHAFNCTGSPCPAHRRGVGSSCKVCKGEGFV